MRPYRSVSAVVWDISYSTSFYWKSGNVLVSKFDSADAPDFARRPIRGWNAMGSLPVSSLFQGVDR